MHEYIYFLNRYLLAGGTLWCLLQVVFEHRDGFALIVFVLAKAYRKRNQDVITTMISVGVGVTYGFCGRKYNL